MLLLLIVAAAALLVKPRDAGVLEPWTPPEQPQPPVKTSEPQPLPSIQPDMAPQAQPAPDALPLLVPEVQPLTVPQNQPSAESSGIATVQESTHFTQAPDNPAPAQVPPPAVKAQDHTINSTDTLIVTPVTDHPQDQDATANAANAAEIPSNPNSNSSNTIIITIASLMGVVLAVLAITTIGMRKVQVPNPFASKKETNIFQSQDIESDCDSEFCDSFSTIRSEFALPEMPEYAHERPLTQTYRISTVDFLEGSILEIDTASISSGSSNSQKGSHLSRSSYSSQESLSKYMA